MKPRVNIILIILLINISFLSAQQKEEEGFILIQGVVFDAKNMKPLPNTHYILNELFGNVTDEKGEFSIYIRGDDTIRFSYVGYRDFLFIPGDTLKGKLFTAGIFLQSDTLSIGEVIVVPRIPNLRTEILANKPVVSSEERNARNNIAASAFEGVHTRGELGDPATNFELLKRKQIHEAYEKGAIPSDRMVGINFLAIPAAIIYFSKGSNKRPEPPPPLIPQKEIDRMKEIYRKNLEKK
ncbi:MAG TPA: hypothetical protein DEQ09_00660 [Bacteroidales bacterium]|nr:hypothetical protein [Bacteroidales bacterium]